MSMEDIKHQNELWARIVYSGVEKKEGVQFFTPDRHTLQMGRQRRAAGTSITPHRHLLVRNDRYETLQEVLYVEKGKVKVSFYGEDDKMFDARILSTGDMILLIKGGHGFEFLEETDMIEVKQGPYSAEATQRLERL